jgi:outer membrane biogenesis lipoprotein LolB
MRLFAIALALLLLGACTKPSDAPSLKNAQDARGDEQYKKELEEVRKDLRGDLKIKLKKDGKGDFYSWEISGKDASEVLKANDVLVKKLGDGAAAK